VSGVYLGKLTAQRDGVQSYIIFIVRDDRKADFLFQCSDTTWLLITAGRINSLCMTTAKRSGTGALTCRSVSIGLMGNIAKFWMRHCQLARGISALGISAGFLDGGARL
jgi:hypothetical protein